MTARQSSARIAEAREIAAKCYMILDFVEELTEDADHKITIADSREGVAQAAAVSHVAALKMGYRDLRDDIEDLSPGDKAEILHRLAVNFGTDVDAEVKAEIASARLILQKGTVANDEEHAMLRVFVEQHADKVDSPQMLERTIQLIADYERTS